MARLGLWSMDWMVSGDSGSNPALVLPFFFLLVFFQKISKYFCRINSAGKGRPAAGSIATAFMKLMTFLTSGCTRLSPYVFVISEVEREGLNWDKAMSW